MPLRRLPLVAALWLLAIAWAAAPLHGRTLLKHVCHVKGQEGNTIQGIGLVVGLKGTGDGGSYLPAIRSLATAMQLMGHSLGKGGPVELKDTKNVALVSVTVRIPNTGAREGERLDCAISSIGSAKSLAGGRLFMTPLQGPQLDNTRVFGFAEGLVHLDDDKLPTTGKIHQGCRLEEDFFHAFTEDGRITLVLDKDHASFGFANDVATLINDALGLQTESAELARAIDPGNVSVNIPAQYRDSPVEFIAQVLNLLLQDLPTEARVVVNQRAGSIVISGDVEIGAVVVSHKNIVIETGDNLPADRFIAVDTAGAQTTKLQALINAMNAVKVPNADQIEIIKGIERNGKLHGTLIVE
jgi:flagellar P-ring protein FlgI